MTARSSHNPLSLHTHLVFAVLAVLGAIPLGASAQAIVVAPAVAGGGLTAVPVDNPWAVFALGLALMAGAWAIFRSGRHRAGLMSLWGVAVVAAMLWQSPDLRAQLANSFTNPAGESVNFTAMQTPNGGNIQGFVAQDFTNQAGVPLRVVAIQEPTLAQCFPLGFANLLPPGVPPPSPPQSCAVGLTLAQNATCRVDVESICRTLAAANPPLAATITVSPTSLSFAENSTGTVVVTNSAASPTTASNLSASIPGGSNISVQSTTCGASLAIAASCTVTFTSSMQEGPTPIPLSGDNTNSVALDVTVTSANAPTATLLGPTAGPVSGGTAVTVTGTQFVAGNTSVTVDGIVVPAGFVTVNSATSLTFITPAHAAGNVSVSVSTPGGTSSVPGGFTYAAPPQTQSMSPVAGPTMGGTAITVTGNNFITGDTSVIIGGVVIPAGSVTVNNTTSLTFTTPAHAAGNVAVVVTTSSGTSNSIPGGFTYAGIPTIMALAPNSGSPSGGDLVIVTGTNFVVGATSITINGIVIPAGSVTVNSSTSLSFVAPANGAGIVDVSVTTAGGSVTAINAFTYF